MNGENMKTILITGARSGISASVIEKIKNNYNIYVTVHTELQLKAIKVKYQNYKNIKCLKLDITNKSDKEKIKDLDIDILLCIAGVGYGGSISEISMDKVRMNFEVNVFSNFELVQIVIKKMIEKNSGKIIMMSSLASILPIPFLGSYCATKASISMLSHTLKYELKLITDNIKISIIEPGIYDTGFNQVMLENKYSWMEVESFFNNQIEIIRKRENLFFKLLEKNNLDSISNKIVKAIKSNTNKFIYRAPLSQTLAAKIYQIFKT